MNALKHITVWLILVLAGVLIIGCSSPETIEVDDSKDTDDADQASADTEDATQEELDTEETDADEPIEEEPSVEVNDSIEANDTSNDTVIADAAPTGTTVVKLLKTSTAMQLYPNPVQIRVGETVRWVNELDYQNKQAQVKVQAYLGEFRSPMLKYGEFYEHQFNESGEYVYQASPYIEMFGKGTIVVS